MTAAAEPRQEEWKNMFGVCACLGEDFGFNPLWLRIAFGVALIFQPVAVLATYFALGAAVLVSRLVAPNRKRAATPVEAAVPTADNCDAQVEFAQAA